MYATIEAELKQGRIVPLEPDKLPKSGRALIVILSGTQAKPEWKKIRDLLGWLKTDINPGKWQKKIRHEWDHRT